MKSLIYKSLLSVAMLIIVISCNDYDEKTPYPKFGEGVSLRPIPTPWTARPRLSLASPGTGITISMFSDNANDLAKVEIFASYLPATNVSAVASGSTAATYANFIAPVTTAGMLLPQFPDSGTAPVTISYARYDNLLNGKTATGVTIPGPVLPKALLKTLNGTSEISANQSFTLTELATATGIILPASSSATIDNQPAFLLTFVVTKTDGSVFSYINSGPGINTNPATGKVVAHMFKDVSVTPAVVRNYNVIVNGDEGSPFLPGVAIRVAP
jgi:hypothetical protein